MLGKHIRTLGADHFSTLSVSETLDIVTMSTGIQRTKEEMIKQLEEFKRLFGAKHPKTREASTWLMTTITSTDRAIDDSFRVFSVPEGDAEERRWNDEKSRGWDDELHGRLVSTIAKQGEKVREGPHCDWWEEIQVSCYCVY